MKRMLAGAAAVALLTPSLLFGQAEPQKAAPSKNAKVEQELIKILPQSRWINFSHQIIHHGRQVCLARKPKCNVCNLEQICHSKDKTWHS